MPESTLAQFKSERRKMLRLFIPEETAKEIEQAAHASAYKHKARTPDEIALDVALEIVKRLRTKELRIALENLADTAHEGMSILFSHGPGGALHMEDTEDNRAAVEEAVAKLIDAEKYARSILDKPQ